MKYRQVMGEIMFPMVKCRPDISPLTIFLSQHMNDPSETHYRASIMILQYLAATRNAGIHYWRKTGVNDLPEGPLPTLHQDNYDIKQASGTNSNTKKRNSLTGMISRYAGGIHRVQNKIPTNHPQRLYSLQHVTHGK